MKLAAKVRLFIIFREGNLQPETAGLDAIKGYIDK